MHLQTNKMEQAKLILKNHNLKITKTRIAVLKAFLSYNNALSSGELYKSIIRNFDRITIYRTLQSFENSGILHKITSPDGTIKFALCTPHCPSKHHYEKHIHFYCTNCGKIYCDEEFDISELNIKSDFAINSIQIIAEGWCWKCNESKKI